MWISQKDYRQMFAEAAKAAQEARTLSEQNHVLRTTLDWMSHRITQLEKERAQLMFSIAGIKLPTPEYSMTPLPTVSDILNAMPSFEDPGDAEALRMGIKHDETGDLVYGK